MFIYKVFKICFLLIFFNTIRVVNYTNLLICKIIKELKMQNKSMNPTMALKNEHEDIPKEPRQLEKLQVVAVLSDLEEKLLGLKNH